MRFSSPDEVALHKANEYWTNHRGSGRPIPIGRLRAGNLLDWDRSDLLYAEALYQAARAKRDLTTVPEPPRTSGATWSHVPPVRVASGTGNWRADYGSWKAAMDAASTKIEPVVAPEDIMAAIEREVARHVPVGPSRQQTLTMSTLSPTRVAAVRKAWELGQRGQWPTGYFPTAADAIGEMLISAAYGSSYPATFSEEVVVLINLRTVVQKLHGNHKPEVIAQINRDITEMAMMAHRHEVNGRLA